MSTFRRIQRTHSPSWSYACRLILAMVALTVSDPRGAVAAETGELKILPAETILIGPRASQQLLVERCTEDGAATADRTESATYSSENTAVATVDASGVVLPVSNGECRIVVSVDGETTATNVIVSGMGDSSPPSFVNDIEPILAKMGCSMGACHGALAGKGGFRLSLRGYDPAADFVSIARGALGRRVELADPGRSLLLLKPSMAVPHKGGLRLPVDSPEYMLIAEWIASGAPPPDDGEPRIHSLEIYPATARLRPGDEQRLVVRARYDDGGVRDVTPWCKFASANESVALVSEGGQVKLVGHGVGAVTAWFSSHTVNMRIISPYEVEVPQSVYDDAPKRNFIDELVIEQLRQLNLTPAPIADDATFMRRAYLDTIGKLPTSEETRAFLANEDDHKRERLIDDLLSREEFVDYWTYQWSDLLLVNGTRLRPDAVKAFYTWIRDAVARNMPWDDFTTAIVTARGNSIEQGATNFYAIHQDPETMTENLSQAFLGLSIGCAKCHNHPLEKWTNDQYYAMANLMARVRAKGWGGDPRGGDGVRTLYIADEGDLIQPSTGRPQPPAPLDGEPFDETSGGDRREYLADWMTSPENPYFARAITNRVWANFFGVGLVEPVDDLRMSNPPANDALLSRTAEFLVEKEFDLKELMRLILNSAAYQRESVPAEFSELDTRNFAFYYPRRLMAEISLDALSQVTAVPSTFTQIEFPGADRVDTEFYPEGTRAIELYDSAVVSRFLKTFGRHQRLITCQCERSNEPSLVQALHISNGETLREKLAARTGKIESILESGEPNYRIIEELYLSALSRYPTDREMSEYLSLLEEESDDRRELIEDLFWAVLSSREFNFNH